jgi:hypothetical protein
MTTFGGRIFQKPNINTNNNLARDTHTASPKGWLPFPGRTSTGKLAAKVAMHLDLIRLAGKKQKFDT